MTGAAGRELVRYTNPVFDSSRWDGFELRPDDIIISTPPKCGTTWTQMIVALLLFQTPQLPAPLAKLSPWLDMRTRARRDVFSDLEAQNHRRFIKSHTPLPGLPTADGVTYICAGRDPRDVALSMRDHLDNIDWPVFFAACAAAAQTDGVDMPAPPPPPDPDADPSARAAFWRWVLDDAPLTANLALPGMLHHVQSFWDARDAENVVMVHYSDLKQDLEGEMRRLAERLGIEVAEERWPALVQAASFSEMRRDASNVIPNSDIGFWRNNDDFFKKARSGEWREIVDSDEDVRRYDERVAALAPADLREWLHRS